jgi:hypothetical protein
MTYRLPTSTITLPHTENDIKVPVNRISDNITFNSRISMLNDNFNYIKSIGEIVDNKSPQFDPHIYSFNDGEWDGNSPTDHDYKQIEVVDTFNGQNLYICAKSTSIDFYLGGNIAEEFAISATPISLTLKISYTQIKQNGNQGFRNIKFIKYDSERLYVYDSGFGGLVVYDLAALLYGDVVIENIKFVRQFTQLKNLININFSSNIYAISNTELIQLNRDLNIVNKVTLASPNPIDIIVGENITILYSGSIDYYNLALSKFKTVEFNGITPDNIIAGIESIESVGIIYILTSDNVYKYDNVNNNIISYFKLFDDNTNIADHLNFALKGDNTSDELFILDTNKIRFCLDSVVFKYLYDRNNLLDADDISNLSIENLEVEQDFVYNTVLQKALFNNLLLYNSLIFKAVIQTDTRGFLEYQYMENLVNSEVLNPLSVFIGQNEVFSFQVFNRCLLSILEIQNKIIRLMGYKIRESSTNTLII